MTYEVLEKFSKREIIDFLKENVMLPPFSDEYALCSVKLKTQFLIEEKLSEKFNAVLSAISAETNPIRQMKLHVELQKLSEQMTITSDRINKLLFKEGRCVNEPRPSHCSRQD